MPKMVPTRGEDIHRVAERPVDLLLEDGIEAGADGQGQVVAKAEVGQHQADDGVDGPGVKAPVEEGGDHGLAGGHLGRWRRLGRGDEVTHGLAPPKYMRPIPMPAANSMASQEVKLNSGRHRPAQANVAKVAEGDHQQQDQEHADHQHIEPAEVLGYPALAAAKEAGGGPRAREQMASSARIKSRPRMKMGSDRVHLGDGERSWDTFGWKDSRHYRPLRQRDFAKQTRGGRL